MPWRLHTVLFVLATLAFSGTAWSEEPTAKASAHFEAGLNYVDDPDGPRYEEAYREFKVAYAESRNWKILANLGTCAFYLERDGEAIEAYEAFLAQSGDRIEEERRRQVEKDLATLKTSVVRLRLTVTPENATITDQRSPAKGAPIVNSYAVPETRLGLGIHPGRHRITVSAAGYRSEVWEFEAQPGEKQAREFRLKRGVTAAPRPAKETQAPSPAPPPMAPEPTPMTHVYVAAAGTGALLAGAAVAGGLALSTRRDFDAANGVNRSEAASLHRQTEQLNAIADVLLGASVGGEVFFGWPSSHVSTGLGKQVERSEGAEANDGERVDAP